MNFDRESMSYMLGFYPLSQWAPLTFIMTPISFFVSCISCANAFKWDKNQGFSNHP